MQTTQNHLRSLGLITDTDHNVQPGPAEELGSGWGLETSTSSAVRRGYEMI